MFVLSRSRYKRNVNGCVFENSIITHSDRVFILFSFFTWRCFVSPLQTRRRRRSIVRLPRGCKTKIKNDFINKTCTWTDLQNPLKRFFILFLFQCKNMFYTYICIFYLMAKTETIWTRIKPHAYIRCAWPNGYTEILIILVLSLYCLSPHQCIPIDEQTVNKQTNGKHL